jgi:Flp pilus assembly protein TadG
MKATVVNRIRHEERGSAMLEMALTIPMLLLISVGIFEFGRAYQTWQIMTNAAREGARLAVLPSATEAGVKTRVKDYLKAGELSSWSDATIALDPAAKIDIGGGGQANASLVTVEYPFKFMVLGPIAKLVDPKSSFGTALTLKTSAEMRNESQF